MTWLRRALVPLSAVGLLVALAGLFLARKSGRRWRWTPLVCEVCWWCGPLWWCPSDGGEVLCPRCGDSV